MSRWKLALSLVVQADGEGPKELDTIIFFLLAIDIIIIRESPRAMTGIETFLHQSINQPLIDGG